MLQINSTEFNISIYNLHTVTHKNRISSATLVKIVKLMLQELSSNKAIVCVRFCPSPVLPLGELVDYTSFLHHIFLATMCKHDTIHNTGIDRFPYTLHILWHALRDTMVTQCQEYLT